MRYFDYEDNRIHSSAYSYDADGRETKMPGGGLTSPIYKKYDAAGRGYESERTNPKLSYQAGVTLDFDGDGAQIKEEVERNNPTYAASTYFYKSSILGRVYQTTWSHHLQIEYSHLTVAYLDGSRLAFLEASTTMVYENPATGAERGMAESEPDPLGVNAGLEPPPSTLPTEPPGEEAEFT